MTGPMPAGWYGIVRVLCWVGAVVSGILGCLAVLTPGRWIQLEDAPVALAVPYWITAIILGGVGQMLARQTVLPYRPADMRSQTFLTPRRRFITFGVVCAIGAFAFQTRTEFTFLGVLCWIGSVGSFYVGFMPDGAKPLRNALAAALEFPSQHPKTAVALVLITGAGVVTRALNLVDIPREMNADHIEKLLNVQQILDGNRAIFFASNGGRESLHMYFMALLTPLTGGANFATLKLAALLESVVGIVAMYGFGHALAGGETARARQFGLFVALVTAVGYWHLVVTRTSLRIMLTPLVTTLALWLLIRLIRYHRRQDAIWVGIVLGIGFYSYQSLRLAPALAIVAVLVSVVWTRRRAIVRRDMANLVIAGVMTVAVCMPLFRYAVGNWAAFWSRLTSTVVDLDATCNEQVQVGCAALAQTDLGLARNYAATLLMFTYRGDQNTAYNASSYPAFDPLGGALLLTGLGAAVVFTVQRRDPVLVFVALACLVMFIPGAMTVARPEEIPNNTRTSGSMPVIYAIVAFGLFQTVTAAVGLVRCPLRPALTWSLPAAAALAMFIHGWGVLSGPFAEGYYLGAVSMRDLGRFSRAYVNEVGGWGNLYFVDRAHYLDLRVVMVEAGLPPGHLPNTSARLDQLPAWLYANLKPDARTPLNPDRDLMFIFSYQDTETLPTLMRWFPNGFVAPFWTWLDHPDKLADPVVTYRVPAMGREQLYAFLRAQNVVMDEVTGE